MDGIVEEKLMDLGREGGREGGRGIISREEGGREGGKEGGMKGGGRTCVVLPQPVSPEMTTSWCFLTVVMMVSRSDQAGSLRREV